MAPDDCHYVCKVCKGVAAAEDRPAAPYLVELATRTREKARVSAPLASLGLVEAKALARAELADLT